MAAIWWVLSFVGVAAIGMLVKEAHASLAIAARLVVNRAADRLPGRWSEIRREEWLALLDKQDGMPIVKLLTSIGLFTAAIRSQLRYRLKRAAESAASTTADGERQQALLIFVLILIVAMAARALQADEQLPASAEGSSLPDDVPTPAFSKFELIDNDWQQWALPGYTDGYVDDDPVQWYRHAGDET